MADGVPTSVFVDEKEISDHDVIIRKGGNYGLRPANKSYKRLIELNSIIYNILPQSKKLAFARNVCKNLERKVYQWDTNQKKYRLLTDCADATKDERRESDVVWVIQRAFTEDWTKWPHFWRPLWLLGEFCDSVDGLAGDTHQPIPFIYTTDQGRTWRRPTSRQELREFLADHDLTNVIIKPESAASLPPVSTMTNSVGNKEKTPVRNGEFCSTCSQPLPSPLKRRRISIEAETTRETYGMTHATEAPESQQQQQDGLNPTKNGTTEMTSTWTFRSTTAEHTTQWTPSLNAFQGNLQSGKGVFIQDFNFSEHLEPNPIGVLAPITNNSRMDPNANTADAQPNGSIQGLQAIMADPIANTGACSCDADWWLRSMEGRQPDEVPENYAEPLVVDRSIFDQKTSMLEVVPSTGKINKKNQKQKEPCSMEVVSSSGEVGEPTPKRQVVLTSTSASPSARLPSSETKRNPTMEIMETAITDAKKREAHLEELKNSKLTQAKSSHADGNKDGAIRGLRKFKQLDSEVKKAAVVSDNLESQAHAIEGLSHNANIFKAMKVGANTMKELASTMPLEEVDDVMGDIRDGHQHQLEVSDILLQSPPNGLGMDDDALEDELKGLVASDEKSGKLVTKQHLVLEGNGNREARVLKTISAKSVAPKGNKETELKAPAGTTKPTEKNLHNGGKQQEKSLPSSANTRQTTETTDEDELHVVQANEDEIDSSQQNAVVTQTNRSRMSPSSSNVDSLHIIPPASRNGISKPSGVLGCLPLLFRRRRPQVN